MVPRRIRTQPTVAFLADEGTQVKAGEVVVVLESEDLVTNYKVALDELAIAQAETKQMVADMALQRLMLEAEMRRLESVAATARLQLPKLQFAAPRLREIQELEMKKSELEAEKIKRKLASLTGIEREELKHLQAKENQAGLKLKNTKEFLEKLIMKAPVDGMIVRSRNWRTGNKVQEGDVLGNGWPVAMIPDLSVMQVKARVGETEAQRLSKDQEAVVTIPSIEGLALPAHITNVANVATPIKRNSKVKMVEIVVEIDSTHAALVPGLTAACRITIEHVSQAMVVPLECIFEQDSLKVVYAKDGDLYTPQQVTIAQQGTDFAVITDGVVSGSDLALRKPSAELIRED